MGIIIDRTDGLASSSAMKGPVRCATTQNIILSGLQVIDGIAVQEDDRVLVKDQTDARANGLYVASVGLWRRARDFNNTRDVRKGTMVIVTDGEINSGEWYVTTANPVAIDISEITFARVLTFGLAPGEIMAAVVFETKAQADANLDYPELTAAWVVEDQDPNNNGIYQKQGDAGSGSWLKLGDFPRSWTPLYRIILRGQDRVMEIYDWTGGWGAKPPTGYIGPNGLTQDIDEATNIRGQRGLDGPGTGDMLQATYDPTGVSKNAFDGFPVGNRPTLKALDTSQFSAAFLTEAGREGKFVWRLGDYSALIAADTQEGIYLKSNGVPASQGAWVREYNGPMQARWFGASKGGSLVQNKAALQAAITMADATGGAEIEIWEPYGYKLLAMDTHPDLSHCVNDVVVRDGSPGSSYAPPNKDGAQVRYFFSTHQAGAMSDSGGLRIFSKWPPYLFISNNAVYAAPGDPTRTALDNRRATVLFANNGQANWVLGQGTESGANLTDDQMSAFCINVFNVPAYGITQSRVFEMLKTDLSVFWDTGSWAIRYRPTAPATLTLSTRDAVDNSILLKSALNDCGIIASGKQQVGDTESLSFKANTAIRWSIYRNGGFIPGMDNLNDVGHPSFRLRNIYAVTSTIGTSDEREKVGIIDATDDDAALRAIRKVKFKRWQFRDAIALKGEDKARLHFGVIAQEIKAAFESEGLDAFRYGLLCHDTWDASPAELDDEGKEIKPAIPAGDRYGVRLDQVLALKLAAIEQDLAPHQA
ncbi:tail fiber domain-containing protein [Brucella sp. IR073]|uniref:tail fiber domain-containing protein n=1 Tax=unclassified Brucella TaxID=2632610 RepID=UPI003B97E276